MWMAWQPPRVFFTKERRGGFFFADGPAARATHPEPPGTIPVGCRLGHSNLKLSAYPVSPSDSMPLLRYRIQQIACAQTSHRESRRPGCYTKQIAPAASSCSSGCHRARWFEAIIAYCRTEESRVSSLFLRRKELLIVRSSATYRDCRKVAPELQFGERSQTIHH